MIVTIHRGAREVGGSCIEVRSGDTRLILDVGLPLVDGNRDPFDSFKALRKTREELIADGTIPAVPGLFTADAPAPAAILLSHAHLDHVGLLHHSRPEIPVYATAGTSKMMLAGGVFANRERLDRGRHEAVTPGMSFDIGPFAVTPLAVDHSTFGCVAYLIEADGKSLLYSGDLRTHGRAAVAMETLVRHVAPKNVDVLLMEGTHLGREASESVTEADLEERVVRHLNAAPGLALAAFSPQNVDRMTTFHSAARRAGRTVVADVYAAFVLRLVNGADGAPLPTRRHGVRVYYNASFRKKRNVGKIAAMFDADRIEMADILAEPAKHMMVFRPSMTAPDFGDCLPACVRVLYSMWAGYLDKPDWVTLKQQVAAAGGAVIPAHASGHIHVEDLKKLVSGLNAKAVVPIHTFEPGMFREMFPNAVPLADGQAYTV